MVDLQGKVKGFTAGLRVVPGGPRVVPGGFKVIPEGLMVVSGGLRVVPGEQVPASVVLFKLMTVLLFTDESPLFWATSPTFGSWGWVFGPNKPI